MCEEWREIKGYEGIYEVSNMGRVKRVKTQYILKPIKNRLGYCGVMLSKKGKPIRFLIHRLVASAFLMKKRKKYNVINHKDGNPQNNHVENLEWCTQAHNLKYSHVHKRCHLKNEKPVLMYKDGKFIKEFRSITKAANAIDSYQQHVTRCLYNEKSKTRGYSFRFKDKEI